MTAAALLVIGLAALERNLGIKERSIRHLKQQTGSALVIALLIMVVLSVVAVAFLGTAQTEDMIATNYRNHTQAFYASEAGLESGLVSLRTLLSTTGTPTDADLVAIAPPALTDPNYTFTFFRDVLLDLTPHMVQTSLGLYNVLTKLQKKLHLPCAARHGLLVESVCLPVSVQPSLP